MQTQTQPGILWNVVLALSIIYFALLGVGITFLGLTLAGKTPLELWSTDKDGYEQF